MEPDQPYSAGGIILGPPIRMPLRDFFEYVGEHLIYADGSMKRWTGDELVPCAGCDYPDHRRGAAAFASARALTS